MNAIIIARARAYAALGWPVFPCKPGTKQPATRHGFLDASTDPGKIDWWWRRDPAANLAIATGAPGPDVLDVDQHGSAGSGFAALSRLKTAGLLDDAGAIVTTPSGGMHVYFAGSDQPSRRLPGHHLDLRARGGYVLAPPSAVGGRPYQTRRYPSPAGDLDWNRVARLLEPSPLLTPAGRPGGRTQEHGGDLSGLVAWTAALAPDSHNRNDGLFWAACRAAEAGNDDVLAQLADAASETGLTAAEIRRTIESARRTAERDTARRASERQPGIEAAP